MSGHTLSDVFFLEYDILQNQGIFLSHILLIYKYAVYSCPKFTHKQHTHEFQLLNIIRVF